MSTTAIAETPTLRPDSAGPAPVSGDTAETPRVLDTYALFYGFALLFFVPGALAVGQLPFRTYTFTYVSLVTVPFVLGLIATFLTDSSEPIKQRLLRIAILTPLVMLTGVTVLFTSSIALLPINQWLGPEYREVTTPLAALLLVAIVSPLAVASIRRLPRLANPIALLQVLVMVAALVLVAVVVYLSVAEVGRLGELSEQMRKDVVIYVIGALVWYLPAMGISAGVWRRLGLV